jgi:hypothetical protein
MFCNKQWRNLFNWRCVFMTVRMSKKPPVPAKGTIFILFKVRSCQALLRTLLVCVHSYLKIGYEILVVLIVDACHQHTLYSREQ